MGFAGDPAKLVGATPPGRPKTLLAPDNAERF